MKTGKLLVCLFLLLFIFGTRFQLNAQMAKVPGVVVNHIPASTKVFIGSPSICILPNGDYVASHDHFGPATTEHSEAIDSLFINRPTGVSRGRKSLKFMVSSGPTFLSIKMRYISWEPGSIMVI